MNVASRELCQELYEVSGWHDTYFNQWFDSENHSNISHDAALFGYGEVNKAGKVWCLPAYDLGYLLRKLPLVRLEHVALDSDDLNRWKCSHPPTDEAWGVIGSFYGETPEDAACKLAIELFNQGILVKEQS